MLHATPLMKRKVWPTIVLLWLALVTASCVGSTSSEGGSGNVQQSEVEAGETRVSPASTSKPGVSAGSPSGAPEVGGLGAEVVLPLDWFSELRTEIGQRETDLYFAFMEHCMAGAGFQWEAPIRVTVPEEWADFDSYPDRYGVVTLGRAEAIAYRLPLEVLGANTEEDDGDGLPSDPALREAFQLVWFGPDVEATLDDLVVIDDPVSGQPLVALERSAPLGRGCQGEANVWLAGKTPTVDSVDVSNELDVARAWISARIRADFDATLADDRVVSVASDWRTCMGEKGWERPASRFPGGIDVAPVLSASLSEDELSPELERLEQERGDTQMAADDVRCQEEVHWLSSLRAVELGHQQETVERVPDLFAAARDLLETYEIRLAGLRLEDLDQ